MVKEYNVHAVYDAFVHAHLDTTIDVNKQVVLMDDTILMQVVSLTLLISVIVRRYDDDLLSQVS